MTWSWPMQTVPRTYNTRFRAMVGVFPLQPLPSGKLVEMRLYLKQWGEDAAEPLSWCTDEMKFAANTAQGPWTPLQPLQHSQISEQDWTAWYGAWGATGAEILAKLDELKRRAPPAH